VNPPLTAPAPPTPHPGWSAGRVVSVVVGSIMALASLGLLGGGFAGLVADRTMRDGGYLMAHVGDLRSNGFAAVADDFEIGGTWAGDPWPARLLGDVRVSVTGNDSATPVFAGIARSTDVEQYLGDVARSVQTGTAGGRRDVAGVAPASPPTALGIWVAQASGTGTQDVVWKPAPGRWALVVMNADGSAVVDAHVHAGATVPALTWVAATVMVGGLVLLVVATLLIVLPVRAATRHGS
jgi:hypothetical protein